MEDFASSLTCRVGIVGSGPVAAAAAHPLLRQGLAHELIAVAAPGRRSADAVAELVHAHTPVGATSLHVGGVDDLARVRLVVLALEDGDDPADDADAITQTMHQLDRVAPNAVVLVVGESSNCGTCYALRATTRPGHKVFGLGTCEETVELRRRVSEHHDVSTESVYALVIGHHGDAAVPVWSQVLIGGHPIVRGRVNGCSFDREAMWGAFHKTCDRATAPIDTERRRAVLGRCIGDCVQAVLLDRRAVMPVAARVDGPFGVRGVCLALPTIIGKRGVEGRILPELSPDEEDAFRRAAQAVGQRTAELERTDTRA
jgi:L-lactate dehydrogenase